MKCPECGEELNSGVCLKCGHIQTYENIEDAFSHYTGYASGPSPEEPAELPPLTPPVPETAPLNTQEPLEPEQAPWLALSRQSPMEPLAEESFDPPLSVPEPPATPPVPGSAPLNGQEPLNRRRSPLMLHLLPMSIQNRLPNLLLLSVSVPNADAPCPNVSAVAAAMTPARWIPGRASVSARSAAHNPKASTAAAAGETSGIRPYLRGRTPSRLHPRRRL